MSMNVSQTTQSSASEASGSAAEAADSDRDEIEFGALSLLWRESRGERVRLLFVLVLSFVVGVMETAAISLAVLLLVPVVGGGSTANLEFRGWTLPPLQPMILVGVGMVLLRWACAVFNDQLTTGSVMRLVLGFRGRLLRTYLAAGWPVQSQERSASVQDRLFRSAQAVSMLLQNTVFLIRNAITLLTMLLGAFVASPLGSTAAIVLSSLLVLATRPLSGRAQRSAKLGQQEALRGVDLIRSSLDSVRELTVYGTAEAAYHPMMEQLARYERHRRGSQLSAYKASHLYFSAVLLSGWLALAATQWIATDRLASLGVVGLLLLRSLGYSRSLQAGFVSLRSSLPIYWDAMAFERRMRAGLADQQWGDREPKSARIELVHVSFRYPDGDRNALNDLCLEVSEGESLAVIGPSGGGKSTLAQVLLGLRRPTDGQLLVGGVPLSEIDRDWWSSGTAVVTQENRLLDASLLDNVRFFRAEIDEERVRDALALVGLDTLVDELPAGLLTQVGEGGQRLSGGQRQRLCIARALAGGPRLVVLDEPTSALDVHSERVVQECLERLRGCCTLVVIAHRLSTIRSCERVIVLQDGRMTDSGSPAELEERTSYFRESLELSRATSGA